MMSWRPDKGESGLAFQGQLGSADGSTCGQSGGIEKAPFFHPFDVLPAMNSRDVLQAGWLRLHKSVPLQFTRGADSSARALDGIG
jgi:hypothetical protein